ncbi:MAG: hypothetical protein ACYC2T_02470 [Bacillota bacterium]
MRDLLKHVLVIVLAVALVSVCLNTVAAKMNSGDAGSNPGFFKAWRDAGDLRVSVMGKEYLLPAGTGELTLPQWKNRYSKVLDKANQEWQRAYRHFNEQLLTWGGS